MSRLDLSANIQGVKVFEDEMKAGFLTQSLFYYCGLTTGPVFRYILYLFLELLQGIH